MHFSVPGFPVGYLVYQFSQILTTPNPVNMSETEFEDKQLPLTKAITCVTDGAPAIIGCHYGFIQRMKTALPRMLAIHCITHCQYLVAKHLSPELDDSLQVYIKAVNEIKAFSLNDLFCQCVKIMRKIFSIYYNILKLVYLKKGCQKEIA